MFIADVVFIFVFAILLSGLVMGPLRWRHPGGGSGPVVAIFLFLLFLLGMMVAALWLEPVGPAVAEVNWAVPTLSGILILFLVLALAAPPPAPSGTAEEPLTSARSAMRPVFSVFVWLLLIALVVLIGLGAM